MRILIAIAMLAVSAEAMPAEPLDRLFSTPHLGMLAAEQPLTYRHIRTSTVEGTPADLDEVITLGLGADGAQVLVTMDAAGQPRPSAFRGMSGNPILMVFLESVVRTVSETTGGSPFYLRNRIKEAMRDRMGEKAETAELNGSKVAAHRIELRPFAGDRHAEELGPFADLELSFLLAEAAPGTFLSLRATTDKGKSAYSEEIRLDATR